MSGGKETPRQKMIGMMYLVLTALLALNVSKQIIQAFVTLNDKLDSSAMIINKKNDNNYFEFDKKKATLTATRGNMDLFNIWNNKALGLREETTGIIGFLLGECNDMIKESEGEDWVAEKDDNGNIVKLKSLNEIEGMDNYDIPTAMFVGGNPNNPIQRGLELTKRIHAYRNFVCESMGNYKQGSREWIFIAPEKESELEEAFISANPSDTSAIAQFYRSLTIPASLYSHGEQADMPWVSVTFDHAPIVAAVAMFTSLKLDIKNGESLASDFMLSKIDVQPFIFNKIKPLTYTRTSNINQGDSLLLDIMIAAYDSTNIAKIRWGMDADTLPEKWTETEGGIQLNSSTPGAHVVKGAIGVRERGELTWKPWSFKYNVGQPMGVVSLPKLNVLYRNFDNIVQGTASGFPTDRITLKGTNCTLRKDGNNWVAHPGSGRSASITVYAKKDDGTTISMGQFDFRVQNLPKPTVYLAGVESGTDISKSTLKNARVIQVKYPPEIPLDARFTLGSWTLKVSSAPRAVPGRGTTINEEAQTMLRQAERGDMIKFTCNINYPGGTSARRNGMFTVK